MAGNTGSLGRIELQEPEDLNKGSDLFQVQRDVMQTVLEMGLRLPELPSNGYRGQMPPTVTALDDDQLGDLLSNLSEYGGFIEAEVAKAQGAKKDAETTLNFLKARVRIGLKAMASELGRLTKTDKDDIVTTDPRIVEAEAESLYRESVYLLTRALLKKVDQDWDTVSRRITQRGQDVERMKRSSNIAGVPTQARTFRRPGQ